MGNNALRKVTPNSVFPADGADQYFTALSGDLYPRDISGNVASGAANLGSPTIPWGTMAAGGLVLGSQTVNEEKIRRLDDLLTIQSLGVYHVDKISNPTNRVLYTAPTFSSANTKMKAVVFSSFYVKQGVVVRNVKRANATLSIHMAGLKMGQYSLLDDTPTVGGASESSGFYQKMVWQEDSTTGNTSEAASTGGGIVDFYTSEGFGFNTASGATGLVNLGANSISMARLSSGQTISLANIANVTSDFEFAAAILLTT
jgi:hypothetical protein